MKIQLIILLLLFSFGRIFAVNQFKVHTDFIYIEGKQAYIDLYIQSDTNEIVNLDFICEYNPFDEIDYHRLATIHKSSFVLTKGLNKIQLKLSERQNINFDDPFYQIIKKNELLPVGDYTIKISILNNRDTFKHTILRIIPSELPTPSTFTQYIDNTLKKGNGKFKMVDINRPEIISKLEKEFAKKELTIQCKTEDKEQYIYFFSNKYFLGKYRMKKWNGRLNQSTIKEQVLNKKESIIENGIENYESIFSQFKTENLTQQDEVSGYLGVSANMGNQADAFSGQQRNYYEFEGGIDAPVLDIPVKINAFYTTQDINRKIKASYFQIEFNAEKLKEKLMIGLNAYKQEYKKVEGKSQNIEGEYQGFLKSLKSQKESILISLLSQTGLTQATKFIDQDAIKNGEYKLDSTALFEAMMVKVDSLKRDSSISNSILYKKQDSVRQVYAKVMKRYNELKQAQEKYTKYSSLVKQYKNTAMFDSILGYNKIKHIDKYQDMTYKDMAKAATNLLPDGKIKRFATGITNFNVGMFSKLESKYTLAGQQLKGINLGYDIGFGTVDLTAGNTQFIGRTGVLDRYTFYTGKLKSKPILKQQLDFIYYGYTPSRRMFNEDKDFFKNINSSIPTFRKPTHILSFTQQGKLFKWLQLQSEVAYSAQSRESETTTEQVRFHDKLAYSLEFEGQLPVFDLDLALSYEHVGLHFENNTLPFNAQGTDRVRAAAKGMFLKNSVQAGIEWNYILQHNLFNDTRNIKWGFDLKTKSKRYPNIIVSYKPFSTFRSIADTFFIPQRPIIGDVLTGKISYQYKRKDKLAQFQLLLNRSKSTIDTVENESNLFQFSANYTTKRNSTFLSISRIDNRASAGVMASSWHFNNKYMLSICESVVVNDKLNSNMGIDLGLSQFGVSSKGINAGVSYKTVKLPLVYRAQFRYARYKITEAESWTDIIRCTIALNWQFKYNIQKDEQPKK